MWREGDEGGKKGSDLEKSVGWKEPLSSSQKFEDSSRASDAHRDLPDDKSNCRSSRARAQFARTSTVFLSERTNERAPVSRMRLDSSPTNWRV